MGSIKIKGATSGSMVLTVPDTGSDNVPVNVDAINNITGKNLIINGGFDVWQRGTTSTTDNDYATADRWFKYAAGDTTSWGKGTDSTVGNYCTVTANSTGYCNLRQNVEGFHISGATTFTLSFYMKGSVGGFPIRLEVWNLTDNNNTYSDTNMGTGTTSWVKHTVTFQMDATDTFDNFRIMLGSNAAAAGETIYLSQVQLEVGSVATNFEHRSYGEELALCQRYYETSNGNIHWATVTGVMSASYTFNPIFSYAVTKRVIPTLSLNVTAGVVYQIIGNKISQWDMRNNSGNQSGGADKYISWTSDAEL